MADSPNQVEGGINPDVFEREKAQIMETMKDRRAVRMVRDFMERSSQYRRPFLEIAKKSREQYENWSAAGRSLVQRANLKLPFAFTIIETQTPQIMDIFFKAENPVQVRGHGPEDAVWEAPITDFMTVQFREMAMQVKSSSFIKSMLLDGTAFAKVPYRFKEVTTVRRRSEVDPLTGESFSFKVEAEEVEFDGPDLENIPIYDFYPDWSVKNPGDVVSMRGVVHRTFKTEIELRRSGRYKNLDQIEVSLTSRGINAWKTPHYDDANFKQDFERLAGSDDVGMKDAGRIEVWEYWGLFDPESKGEFKECILTIANGDVVLRMEENFYDAKFKPFVACPNYIRDGEFYGLPETTPIRSLIKEANALRNSRLDAVNLSVNPMWVVDRAAGINPNSLYSRPGGIIWANDPNGLKNVTMGDPSNGSANELLAIQQDIQNATALVNAAPIVSQLGKQFGRSATGVNFIQSFSSSRIGLKARLLSDLYFKRVASIMMMTNQQFVTDEAWVRVSDPNSPNPWVSLPPDAFSRKFDFAMDTVLDNGGPEGQLEKMQTVAQLLQVFENSQPGTTNTSVLLEAMLRPILGKQVARFVRTDEERAQLQAQNLAAQQAVNAQQGSVAPQPNANFDQQSAGAQALAALGLEGT